MTESHSKSRKQAEIAFGNAQSQFLARSRAVEEIDSTVRAREEKPCDYAKRVRPRNCRIA